VNLIDRSAPLAEWSRLIRQIHGKGCHRAVLNFGDCFAYALAKATGKALLLKGADFPLTDIEMYAPA
jgi:ribonuclease VapC